MGKGGSDRHGSVWSDTSSVLNFKSLKKDIKTDVLIIGGGMAGILCAYMLGQAGVDYVLVEADTVCSGITKNTTAKITSQHGLVYHKLLKSLGTEKADLYLRANQEAVKKYAELCSGIECDFERKDAYVYSLDDPRVIAEELDALQRLNFPAESVHQLPLPFPVAGAVRFTGQAQFHPLKFVNAIAKDLNIYEHTEVRELEGSTARTDSGVITADKIIVATHFPFINKHGSYFLKMYQHRSYVIALENAPDLDGMYVDQAQNGMSFRNHDGLLLIGGGGHRTGKTGGSWEELRRFALNYYPGSSERYHWATQDCMTLDNVPYIGHYSKNTPNLYAAAGFNKWGMTSSMVSAMVLTALITEQDSPYSALFSPSRTILRPQLAANALEATMNLLTISSPRCPHLGCALKWNKQEHTWDCPCHGSRFDSDGHLIDNPATGDLKKNPGR
ncbi:FAD-dependent oxidoreductase [uncultured Clostridium sp.]|uniref:FAD-dependent oxidoreductase n=1 Tax=uncultured Clostridium sp. TaxID=59620 RepID=UPI0025EC89FF|nr:FAD-dependent oxidoreductase [uncultured Clostridium sp.]